MPGLPDRQRAQFFLDRLDGVGKAQADEQGADHLAAGIGDGVVLAHVLFAHQRDQAHPALPVEQGAAGGIGRAERGAKGALAIVGLERRGHAHEIAAHPGILHGEGTGQRGKALACGRIEIEVAVGAFQYRRGHARHLDGARGRRRCRHESPP
jgi:hypothetical protein